MKERTYEKLRELAIIDAKRRLNTVKEKIPEWDIVERTHTNGEVEKLFVFSPTMSMLTTLSLNDYGQIREVKYIVWRFDLSKNELETK